MWVHFQLPKKVSFFKTLFESQMYQTPRRNIPEKTNRTIALLLSVFLFPYTFGISFRFL
ncbi:hypothetical protein LEP1GSC170_2070 [Leptospira interrogans serovar Bataviae str. HAI135]|nr:hypothetical protein LEP1GSC170_2070 [Leptospira interrogans serovar Bataviae str. HAI135]